MAGDKEVWLGCCSHDPITDQLEDKGWKYRIFPCKQWELLMAG